MKAKVHFWINTNRPSFTKRTDLPYYPVDGGWVANIRHYDWVDLNLRLQISNKLTSQDILPFLLDFIRKDLNRSVIKKLMHRIRYINPMQLDLPMKRDLMEVSIICKYY